jgi:hypothetical protein
MSAIFWFWIGTVVGSFVGFGCFCLLQAASDPDGETPREMMRR